MVKDGIVLVIGAAALDLKGRPASDLQAANCNPGIIRQSFGGVGRNIAENLARLGLPTVFLTVLGYDSAGMQIYDTMTAAGVDMQAVMRRGDCRTGTYIAVLDTFGDLAVAVSDFDSIRLLDAAFVQKHETLFQQARMVVIDLNLEIATIEAVIALAKRHHVSIAMDPTSPKRALALSKRIHDFFLIAPNADEAHVLGSMVFEAKHQDRALLAAQQMVQSGVEIVLITLGKYGVVYASARENGAVDGLEVPIADATGAGDALLAGVIYGLLQDEPLSVAVRLGMTAAVLTLQDHSSVLPRLSSSLLYDHLIT